MKKGIGYLIAALLVGTLVVLMVKSNLEKTDPVDTSSTVVTSAQGEGQVVDEGENETGLGEGDTPPDFSLRTLDGEEIQLSALKGKRVILNFWATWCPPCKAEMPHMENYYKEYHEEDNVEIIAVNLTTGENRGISAVEEFAESYGLTFPIPLDEDGSVQDAYQVYSIPTTFVLESDGTIAYKIIGPMDEKTIHNIVETLD